MGVWTGNTNRPRTSPGRSFLQLAPKGAAPDWTTPYAGFANYFALGVRFERVREGEERRKECGVQERILDLGLNQRLRRRSHP